MKRTSLTAGHLISLVIAGLALQAAPGFVVLLGRAPEITRTDLLSLSLLSEMLILGCSTLTVGVASYLGLTILSKKGPNIVDVISIVSSQFLASIVFLSALADNPQSEFCKAHASGAVLAKVYSLDSCRLTSDFWAHAVGLELLAAALLVGLGRLAVAGLSRLLLTRM